MNRYFHKLLLRGSTPLLLLCCLPILIGSLAYTFWRSPTANMANVAGELMIGQQCRAEPFQHVHRPMRFTLIAPCVAVSGTIQRVKPRDYDGNTVLWVALDPEHSHILAPSNSGLLVAKIIPLDKPSVVVPAIGMHATLHGTLVQSRENDDRIELQPIWLITTAEVVGNITPDP
jgi:hypothetical protein